MADPEVWVRWDQYLKKAFMVNAYVLGWRFF